MLILFHMIDVLNTHCRTRVYFHHIQPNWVIGCKHYLYFCDLYVDEQVQSDQNVSTKDLQAQMRELEKHLEALEHRGVELERNLRGCKDGSADCH